jgi:hypothetical protein
LADVAERRPPNYAEETLKASPFLFYDLSSSLSPLISPNHGSKEYRGQ